MKVLYFDCFSGISGDMTLGALLDLGIDCDAFRAELSKLDISGYEIKVNKVIRNAIHGTDVDIITGSGHEHSHEHEHGHGYEHEHEHGHEHHEHEHSHEEHARNLEDIEHLINTSSLNQKVKDFSKKVFREIARAEATVHNMDVSKVHFHEVGAVDSILDIVGTAICLDMLGIEKVYSSPLHDGQGFITCAHGLLPVPVPAVLEMLKGSRIPYITEDIGTELVTPTGMGIIKSLAVSFGRMPALIVDSIGYGMGKRDIGRLNALRVVMGELFGESDMLEEVSVLETNIDDMSPEIVSYTMEKLLKEGALEAFCTPVVMKKGRPAFMLTVLCSDDVKTRMIDLIFRETTTIGIRQYTAGRYRMERSVRRVGTDVGEAGIKIASMGRLIKASPEYEDCKAIAESTGKPLREVYETVARKAAEIVRNQGVV